MEVGHIQENLESIMQRLEDAIRQDDVIVTNNIITELVTNAQLATKILPEALNITKNSTADKNILYYLIKAGNEEGLKAVIEIWPHRTRDSEILLAEALEKAYSLTNLEARSNREKKIKKKFQVLIESSILHLKFQSNTYVSVPRIPSTFNQIKDRLETLLKCINWIKPYFKNELNDRSEFWLILDDIIKQIYSLKRELKDTFNKIPWIQIRFILVMRSKLYKQKNLSQEESAMRACFGHIFTDEKIYDYLRIFGEQIEVLIRDLKPGNVPNYTCPSDRSNFSPDAELKNLYNDYYNIRNLYSIQIIKKYINSILNTKFTGNDKCYALQRSIQVIFENLKDSWEQPNASSKISDIVYNMFNDHITETTKKQGKDDNSLLKVVQNIRDFLSHDHTIEKRDNWFNYENKPDTIKYKLIEEDLRYVEKILIVKEKEIKDKLKNDVIPQKGILPKLESKRENLKVCTESKNNSKNKKNSNMKKNSEMVIGKKFRELLKQHCQIPPSVDENSSSNDESGPKKSKIFSDGVSMQFLKHHCQITPSVDENSSSYKGHPEMQPPKKNKPKKIVYILKRIEHLKEIFGQANIHDINSIKSFYKKEKNFDPVLEMIVFDIVNLLDSLRDNLHFLLEDYPILVGMELRHFLAHGTVETLILPCDLRLAIICNAIEFIKHNKSEDNNTLFNYHENKINRILAM